MELIGDTAKEKATTGDNMLMWFRERFKNQRPWFRVDSGVQSIEGLKARDGTLEIRVKVLGEESLLKLNRETADKLSNWMARMYPHRGDNVVRIPSKLKSIDSGTPERNL